MANFVYDTFTGSTGALTSHVGETGATWGAFWGWGLPIDITVTDGYAKAVAGGEGSNRSIASGAAGSNDYFVELEVDRTLADINSDVYIFGRQESEYSNYVAWAPMDGGTLSLHMVGANVNVVTPTLPSVCTIRYAVNGADHTVSIDGSVILSGVSTGVGVTTSQVGFGMRQVIASSVGAKVLSFTAGDLIAPPPPLFWTSFVNATEVSA